LGGDCISLAVTATLVAKEAAKGDKDALQDAVCQALFVGAIIALIGTPLMLLFSDGVLGVVLKKGAPALEFAKPYLVIRSCSFLFQMLSIVGFSAFRGKSACNSTTCLHNRPTLF
jgi:Na+-driven multidrug efflux pump